MNTPQEWPILELISPLTETAFWDEIFEKKYHLSTGSDIFSGFDFSRFEELLWTHEQLLSDKIDINRDGHSFRYDESIAGKDRFRWVVDRYNEGCTIIFNGIADIDTTVARTIRPLDFLFKGKTTANAFLTPANAKGFLPHFDTHDVFIVQTEGTKKWALYHTEKELPLDNQIYLIDQEKLDKPAVEFILKPGDVLYIPRGMVHGSGTGDEHSLHITIGIRPLLGIDYLKKMLDSMAENDLLFRKSIARSYANESEKDLELLLAKLPTMGANPYMRKLTREKIDMKLASQSRPLQGHHLDNVEQIEKLDLNTKVVKAYMQNDALVDSGSKIRLVFSGLGFASIDNPRPGFIEFSALSYGALNFIRNTRESFKPKDISDFYTDNDKVLLVKALLTEGYLKFVD